MPSRSNSCRALNRFGLEHASSNARSSVFESCALRASLAVAS